MKDQDDINKEQDEIGVKLDSIFEDILASNIARFVKRVARGEITKAQARERLRQFAGQEIELPPELLDDDNDKLPHDAEFNV